MGSVALAAKRRLVSEIARAQLDQLRPAPVARQKRGVAYLTGVSPPGSFVLRLLAGLDETCRSFSVRRLRNCSRNVSHTTTFVPFLHTTAHPYAEPSKLLAIRDHLLCTC